MEFRVKNKIILGFFDLIMIGGSAQMQIRFILFFKPGSPSLSRGSFRRA